MITVHHYLLLSALSLFLSLAGIIMARQKTTALFCLFTAFSSINLSLVCLSRYYNKPNGQIVALLIMALMILWVALGLALKKLK